MKRSLAFFFIAFATALTLACGSSHRQLQSITVNERGTAARSSRLVLSPPHQPP